MTRPTWIPLQFALVVEAARTLRRRATIAVRTAPSPSSQPPHGDQAAAVATDHDTIRRELTEMRERLDTHVVTSEAKLTRFADDLATSYDRARPASAAAATNDVVAEALWLTNAPLAEHPLITVIMPTADEGRSGYLRSAIDSVIAQTYRNWELIVVDDSVDGVLKQRPDWWPDDSRVTVITSASSDGGLARNMGLAAANGAVVTYLDDDCRFFAWWLHAVAYAFTVDQALAVAYGVRVIEPVDGRPAQMFVDSFDPVTLLQYNPIDTNVLAHRASLGEAHWPEGRESCADYELAVELAHLPIRFLPVPASTYSKSSPGRRWTTQNAERNTIRLAEVRHRARRKRPLRVVAHNGLYPQMSETYIGDELEALARNDVDIVLSREVVAVVDTPSRIEAPLFESLEDAIGFHDPDVVLIHWAGVAVANRERIAKAGVPYAIRTHSFDGGVPADHLIDDWCVGIWVPPWLDLGHPAARPLATLLVDPAPPQPHDESRNGRVLSVSAALPKKDWPVLVEAITHLAVPSLDVIVAQTNAFEWVPDQIRTLGQEHGVDVDLRLDVPYADTQHAIRHAGALVYAVGLDALLGQPRSVIEAGLAATPLVVPQHPAMESMLGTSCHTYRRGDPASLASALESAISDPHPLPTRLELAERLAFAHSSPEVFAAWATSLTEAVVDWRRTHRKTDGERVMTWWSSELTNRLRPS